MNSNQKGKAAEDFAERLAKKLGWEVEFKPVRSVRPIGNGRYLSHRVDYAGLWDFVFFDHKNKPAARRFVQVKTNASADYFSKEMKEWINRRPATDDYYAVWLVQKAGGRWKLVKARAVSGGEC